MCEISWTSVASFGTYGKFGFVCVSSEYPTTLALSTIAPTALNGYGPYSDV